MHLRSKKQELKICEPPAPRSLLTALQMLSNSCQRCCDQSRRLQERQQQTQSPLNTPHTGKMLRSCFLKMPFPWRLRNQDGGSRQFRTWRRCVQTAVFVSSQDRRAKEKHCVFIRRTRAAIECLLPSAHCSLIEALVPTRGQQLLRPSHGKTTACHLHEGDQVLLGGH